MTKLYKIKHDQRDFEIIAKGICQLLGQVPTYPFLMNYEYK